MVESIYTRFAKEVHHYFPQIRQIRSTKRFRKSRLYREILPALRNVLDVCELENFVDKPIKKSPFYRAVSWNVERGMEFEGLVHILKNNPGLAGADIYFLPETDVGMARSKNRNVAKELARALNLNYAFSPCYLNLDKGSGIEAEAKGNNEVGLHGNAILSRWPIKSPRQILLKNCKDKMRGKEKRLGSQRCLVVDLKMPEGPLRIACPHLDAHSSQRQRYHQVKTILDFFKREDWKGPTLIGGDLNTSTYHASHAFFAWWSFWRKMMMGPKYVCDNHYCYPERYFEKRLFNFLEQKGFDYKNFNELGKPTIHYHLGDEKKNKNLHDWVPKFFQPLVDWSVRKAEGTTSLKLDWFVAQNLKPIEGSQRVIGNLTYQGKLVSDHDAIVVNFKIS
ncbi:MAG: hypothetical protein A3F82_05615 [Deltaproteobacteria bacterium RIFCSPLOWO2_12_FULL_44_12]|nr:MAG: hypothetical protein A2712_01690 [Deltaproteobacteria bacterium RIFCSPHIGHO2_01_FULL_43_49]OGQ15160.1 MAG: hypothetical protein A3D22_03785 [Deltaproteobacteria bacterium RIFCSPHIGHO2_02_FULL_44_53]OGQ27219.1 MAG: hypothetical protein A3D98_02285 [Deltaproteobacteria bacterium RIFCSPHIGHO2_12_FULL_44_21]OGQ31677.1 MAG: hypothetical protein A2979_04945 [Deltaproteobacteria bacterium RIFCSPLOWO2_01_FULL_45_74]OGQ42877.1 MAG: hypothetical protein A3I70_07250 [Deltaproteobacteria bacterium 